MSSPTAGELQDDISIFEQSSPESLRARARALSPYTQDQYSTSDGRTLNGDTDDGYFSQYKLIKECTSSRSSISSFPASVVHHIPFTDNEDADIRTPSRNQSYDRTSKTPSQGYLSAFRHPSSVRALQLESEYADSDTLSLRNSPRPRKSPRASHFSPRSPGSVHSSPTKRSSRSGTPLQHRQSSSKLKKEFPLVLLHCTLLPPAVAVRGPLVSDEILEAVLPDEYRKRWRTLQDKVTRNSEVKQRGVLLPHPREDYDLLEERLLETLELERPRIRKGHYLGKEDGGSDSGFESSSQNGTDEGSNAEDRIEKDLGDKCPDCAKAVSCMVEQERKWEVKIFAANGLMRSGAWAAAWEQMEKVDVEVSVWMPEDVRVEVEERLKALQAKEEAEKPVEEPLETKKNRRNRSNTAKLRHDERMKEIYGETNKPKTQAEIDGLVDEKQETIDIPPRDETTAQPTTNFIDPFITASNGSATSEAPIPEHRHAPTYSAQEDFLSFSRRHLHLIWNDQKNLAIVLLSILVLLFSIQNAKFNSTSAPSAVVEGVAHVLSSPITSAESALPSEPPPLSYVTTTVFATPKSASSANADLEEAPAISAELEQEIRSSTESNALKAPSPEADTMDALAVSFSASEVHEDVEDEPIANEPVLQDSVSHTAGNNDLLSSALKLTEVANDECTNSVMPSDLQREQMPVGIEGPKSADEGSTPAPQSDEDERVTEGPAVIDSSTASLDDGLALSSLTTEETDSTLENQNLPTGVEEDVVSEERDDEAEKVTAGTQEAHPDLGYEDANDV